MVRSTCARSDAPGIAQLRRFMVATSATNWPRLSRARRFAIARLRGAIFVDDRGSYPTALVATGLPGHAMPIC